MEVQFLGHAGFVIRAGGLQLLVDPWFHPAFLDSWVPSPPNSHLLEPTSADRYDAVYVSHRHEDHFDHRFLERLPRSTPVLCPKFRSKSLYRSWQAMGFTDVTLVDHGESVELAAELRVTVVLDTSHREDSALLVEDGGFRFL